jgi:hypothetical protein
MIVETGSSFGELSKGECFLVAKNADKRLLMKTEVIFDEKEDRYINAVSLCDGVFHSYNVDTEVIPIPARVSF